MNKKGNIVYLIWIFIIFFIVLFLGFLMIVGSSILNWVGDEATPLLSDLGMVGDANLTETAQYTIAPANSFVQNLTWVSGVLYVMMLIGSVAIAFIIKMSSSKWLIGFYFGLVIILIMGSIFMSNIYEEFQTDTGELSTRLNENTLLSFMVLNSPMIFTAIAFITGIIIFSGISQEEDYV